MPLRTHVELEKRRVYLFWEGVVTSGEYGSVIEQMEELFPSITGAMGVLSDMRQLQSLPSSLLAQARGARWNKHRPLFVAVVGVPNFAKVLIGIYNALTDLGIRTFDTVESAEEWLAEQVARTEGQRNGHG